MGSLQIPNIVKLVRREHFRKTYRGGVSRRIDTLERPRSNNPGRLRPTKNPAPPLSDLASM